MDHAQPRTGQHGDRQFGNHRHVNGDPVTCFEPYEIPQHRRGFIYAVVEFLVGNDDRFFIFRLRHKYDCPLVPVLRQMPVHAVVRCVQLSAYKPLPERRIIGIKDGMPSLVPGQHVRIFFKALGKILFAEPFCHLRVFQVGLLYELFWRVVEFLFLPVNCNVSFARFAPLFRPLQSSHCDDLLCFRQPGAILRLKLAGTQLQLGSRDRSYPALKISLGSSLEHALSSPWITPEPEPGNRGVFDSENFSAAISSIALPGSGHLIRGRRTAGLIWLFLSVVFYAALLLFRVAAMVNVFLLAGIVAIAMSCAAACDCCLRGSRDLWPRKFGFLLLVVLGSLIWVSGTRYAIRYFSGLRYFQSPSKS